MAANLSLLKSNLTTERDQLRQAITSDAANSGGTNVETLLTQAALLTAKIAELTAIGA